MTTRAMFHIQIPDLGICLISSSQIPDLISNSQITEAKWFEIFILLAITGTCVSLAVSIFLHPVYQRYHVMRVTNYLKLLVFLASALQTMSQLLAIMNNDFYCWIIWQIVNNEFYC